MRHRAADDQHPNPGPGVRFGLRARHRPGNESQRDLEQLVWIRRPQCLRHRPQVQRMIGDMSGANAKLKWAVSAAVCAALTLTAEPLAPVGVEPHVPAFSVSYMDRSVDPAADFYSFADGQWV